MDASCCCCDKQTRPLADCLARFGCIRTIIHYSAIISRLMIREKEGLGLKRETSAPLLHKARPGWKHRALGPEQRLPLFSRPGIAFAPGNHFNLCVSILSTMLHSGFYLIILHKDCLGFLPFSVILIFILIQYIHSVFMHSFIYPFFCWSASFTDNCCVYLVFGVLPWVR